MLAPAQKNFSPAPRSTIDVHVLVEPRLENGVVQVAHHLVGVGVGRRIGQLEPRHAVLDAVVDELGLGRFHRDSPLGVRRDFEARGAGDMRVESGIIGSGSREGQNGGGAGDRFDL